MSTEYYTSASVKFGKVCYRGYTTDDHGTRKRVHGRLAYKPTLYLESQDTDSEFKSLYGKPLREQKFDTIPEAREFVKAYQDVMNIYGYSPSRFEYNFLAKEFPGILEVGIDEIEVGTIDIETTTEHGKMDTINVPEEIILISYQNLHSKEIVTYGSRPSTKPNYILCRDEADVLTRFIRHVEKDDPDVLTGWNCDGFDIPYIINKSNKVLGEEFTKKLSPFGLIEMKEEDVRGKIVQKFTIVGRTILDMLQLYLKFTFVKRVNNRLDTIARIELGAGKLENPYATFREFYEQDFDRFVEYNQIDVIRVSELEEKLGLIALAMSIAYRAKINFGDVYGPVKTWECMIQGALLNEGTFASIKRSGASSGGIVGAYVHTPKPGFYEWVMSIDAEALYPSIAIGLNESPETIVSIWPGVNDEDMIKISNHGGVESIEARILELESLLL